MVIGTLSHEVRLCSCDGHRGLSALHMAFRTPSIGHSHGYLSKPECATMVIGAAVLYPCPLTQHCPHVTVYRPRWSLQALRGVLWGWSSRALWARTRPWLIHRCKIHVCSLTSLCALVSPHMLLCIELSTRGCMGGCCVFFPPLLIVQEALCTS